MKKAIFAVCLLAASVDVSCPILFNISLSVGRNCPRKSSIP